jgi:hypothetical protein
MNLITPTQGKSRRGYPRYLSNPSVLKTDETKTGLPRISSRFNNDSHFIRSPARFYDIIAVDKTQLAQLYIQGVAALQDLNAAGIKVLAVLYNEMQKQPNADKIYLHFATVQTNGGTISLATFKRGMNELLAKEIMYESLEPFFYFINVNYLFNGERLAFVREYWVK